MARATAGRALIVIIGGLFFLTGVAAREGVWAKREVTREVTFERDIRPIFAARCLGCHNGARQSGGLRLDQREAAVRDSIIVPGRAAESHLYQRITTTGAEAMPPTGERLTVDQTARSGRRRSRRVWRPDRLSLRRSVTGPGDRWFDRRFPPEWPARFATRSMPLSEHDSGVPGWQCRRKPIDGR